MVTYRTVVAALDAHKHLELWTQAGTAPGCACEHAVRAESGFILAQPPDWNRLRFERDQKRSEEPKESWRLRLAAEGLAGPLEVNRSDWLPADSLRLVDDSRKRRNRRTRPGSAERTRYGFRGAVPPNTNDIPAATIGALLHDGTQLPHLSDTTSAPQELQGRLLIEPIALRTEHGSGPGRHRRLVNSVSVFAANVEAVSPRYSSQAVVRTFEQKICGRPAEKLRFIQNQRENLSA